MGRKTNLAYREKMAERAPLPRCAWCRRRGSRLVRYEDKLLHKACIDLYVAAVKVHEARVNPARRAKRHAKIRDWWTMTTQEREMVAALLPVVDVHKELAASLDALEAAAETAT